MIFLSSDRYYYCEQQFPFDVILFWRSLDAPLITMLLLQERKKIKYRWTTREKHPITRWSFVKYRALILLNSYNKDYRIVQESELGVLILANYYTDGITLHSKPIITKKKK